MFEITNPPSLCRAMAWRGEAKMSLQILQKETYLAFIENSVGTRMFSSLIAQDSETGKITDILENGRYSCAVFVSNLLYLFQMTEKTSATVLSLLRNLENDPRWRLIAPDSSLPGDVIFWEKRRGNDHVGFVVTPEEAVSNNAKSRMIIRHYIDDRGPILHAFRFMGW